MGLDTAANPMALSNARDQVRAALGADDPTAALRSVAIELSGRGLGRAGVQAAFIAVCEELSEAGRDEESALVARVLDMIAEW